MMWRKKAYYYAEMFLLAPMLVPKPEPKSQKLCYLVSR
jgi:hypothetical protein